ncbi:response regulator [Methylomonas sp. EFPC3]|uniref:response regulator n=1 Tax=Methylomonas TaxID=416 RepID=UPI00112DC9C2|nr:MULTISPECIES: response regulator [Methylomonas]TPQ28921.1 response regulator receiver protein [Methylomonas koyamae]WFP50478.1 response regulator [Methylomonas sp. EFPC3]
MNTAPSVLLVEDEEIISIVIESILQTRGYRIDLCSNGMHAWEKLQADPAAYDLVLLDWGLPSLNGIELLNLIKSDRVLADIPVIIETARSDKNSIQQGLSQGAYYYLTKPFQPEVLLAVVDAALEQRSELREMVENLRSAERPLVLMREGRFSFQTLEDARVLATHLARICPEPERAVQGLQELLINAVEHGNLGISYAEKGRFVLAGTWTEEIDRRLQLPEYRQLFAEVCFLRGDDELRFTITDQGSGFDCSGYLDFSPERAFDIHGRGIAMARHLSFDSLEYVGNGNTAIARFKL